MRTGPGTDRVVAPIKLRLLHRTTRRMMRADSHEELFKTATAAASDLLGFEYNTIRRYDREPDVLVPVAVSPHLRETGSERRTYERGETVQWDALDRGELQVFQTVREIDDDADRTGDGSMIVVPLDDYGVLTLGSPEPRAITESDKALARVFGANIETAIDRLEYVQQLRERERELAAKNERLEAFAGKVSHELRNPLNVLAGHLERARETGDETHLDGLESSINRMDRLIDDILTLARTGELELDTEPVALRTATLASWDAIRTSEATLTIETTAAIIADPDRLRQVLENLFRNSVEHGAAGGRGGAVTVTVGDLGNGFYVADDGVGIPQAKREQFVDDDWDADDGSGTSWTGFGLEIVAQIADLHGWSVTVTDSASGGAQFEFRNVTKR